MKIVAFILLVTALVSNTRAVTVAGPNENIVIGDVVVSPTGVTQASQAPDMLPISEGARKVHLLSMAVTGTLQYVGEGLVPVPHHSGKTQLTLNSESSATPAALLTQLTGSSVSIGVANPNRPVTARCELFDINGTLLLSGQAPAEVVPDPRVRGGYSIEQLEPIVLQCEYVVSVFLENAESIDIVSRDEQGNADYNQTIYPNNLGAFDIWSWNYRFGEVIVNFSDGSQAFYSFTTGERQQATATATQSSTTIPNYVEQSVAGRTPTTIVTVALNALYNNGEIPSPPTYRIRVTRPTKLRIRVGCRDAGDNPVAAPTEWWYHRDDDIDEFMVPEFELYDPDSGTATFRIDTKPGVYWIRAEGHQFRQVYWSNWGGVKG
jgi:hypothetical protein